MIRVMKMEMPFGMPILQIQLQTGNSKEEISKPKDKGTKKFFAITITKVKAIIKSRKKVPFTINECLFSILNPEL
jgi:hypothetical protein